MLYKLTCICLIFSQHSLKDDGHDLLHDGGRCIAGGVVFGEMKPEAYDYRLIKKQTNNLEILETLETYYFSTKSRINLYNFILLLLVKVTKKNISLSNTMDNRCCMMAEAVLLVVVSLEKWILKL